MGWFVPDHRDVAVTGRIALGGDRAHEVHVRHVELEERAVAAPGRRLTPQRARRTLRDHPEGHAGDPRNSDPRAGTTRRRVGHHEGVAHRPLVVGEVPVLWHAVQAQLGGRGGARLAHRIAADAVVLRRHEHDAADQHTDDHDGAERHQQRHALLRLYRRMHTCLSLKKMPLAAHLLRSPTSIRSESPNVVAPSPLRLTSPVPCPRTTTLMRATRLRLIVTVPVAPEYANYTPLVP